MSEYMFLYRGGERPATPEKMQQQMQRWMTWLKKLGEQGNLKDGGAPLDRTGKIARGPQKTATDGPYAEKDLVAGYSLVEARDLAHAVELSEECPIFAVGGLVEVRPVMKM
ncbi:MAG TPA: YciI family protein [Polyangiaceae bacterium]|nr:YciI family protein [Polyangiaceae bacterium]